MDRSAAARPWSLVLAGGDGTRLQGLTRQLTGAPIPKQYCRILGTQSLLEATLSRSRLFAKPERTLVVINRDHLAFGKEQLRGMRAGNVLVQPCNRETGPGMLFALMQLRDRALDATVAVFPSDHYVSDDRTFTDYVARAANIVSQHPEKIALLGIRPSYPEPGYGYILPGKPMRTFGGGIPAFRVAAFREKPREDLAQSLLTSGSLWNSFVMVFRVARVLELLRRFASTEFEDMQRLNSSPTSLAAQYSELRAWSFSSYFLARVPQHLIVLPVEDVQWSDWGTPESIESTFRMLNQAPPWKAVGSPRSAA